VSSFEPETLERIGSLAPTWPRWLNADDLSPATIAHAVELRCRGIAAEWRSIDGAAMRRARSADLEVAAWTVRRRPTFARLAALGVTAICVEAAALDG
jgi:glycerophosphoryl diester phosphodiesterase